MILADVEFVVVISQLILKLITLGFVAMALVTILALGTLLVENLYGRSKPEQPKRRRPF
ncbi:hypothetical protein [Bradyrhizobium sp. SZCCHNR1093]|uniref:hypothetical protein n=1 Tax=Bradyrhizobium sp. SZCCHNR1093 TaxID=3057368 RepID=UPI0028E2938F|nr:hypothetical protein [Bradyrhizobium sp. SZCCHNR1093]